ncbi:MAG: exodeoxyribonuclease V subunit alpha [Desulfuromonadaceae bacterium]|nr:exodeoxyribonuclease V subunit alpha [Desulfuromonadaceae bacterium]
MTESIQISALDHHFADFITRIDSNPSDELWLAAALASNAAGKGHTCLKMATVAGMNIVPFCHVPRRLQTPEESLWRDALGPCDTIGNPGDYTPLVLDGANRLYLQRSWEYERLVAEGILARNRQLPFDQELFKSALDHYFPAIPGALDLQREAAIMAASRCFSVVSGGPGTGKTATVARILAMLIELSADVQPEIALAAPTGKAAMRLRNSILQAAVQLDLPPPVRNRLPDDVSTIHRLLGVKAGGNGFMHNRDNRLACDILVIDEASMIDLPLMAQLLEALRDDARIILLGDRDQLASVEAGAVLADICAGASSLSHSDPQLGSVHGEGGNGNVALSVVNLTKSHRFGQSSGIGALSRLINSGESAAALELLFSGGDDDLVWRPLPVGNSFGKEFITAVRMGYSAYAASDSPKKALAELDRFRVLSPLRSSMYGVENLNELCVAALGFKRSADEQYYRLMPVMVAGNNYELGLFNGDTGVVMDNDGRPSVWFSAQDGGLRHLSPIRLPAHETAFALTVHKSQGSEFDKLLLILPDRISEALSRELLYTAVTRARNSVEIWGTEDVFRQAVERRTERSSGLRDRLAGGMK